MKSDTHLRMYEAASTSRVCEELMWSKTIAGEIQLLVLPSNGQELLGVALGTAMDADDYLATYYRGIPEQIAKGMNLRTMWAEMLQRGTGTSKGKGGRVHLIQPDVGIMVNSGIVGAQIPIAVGLALASQLRGDNKVTVCTFGDGAISQGGFHEGLNLASLWNLPLVFVCENNGYAENTPFHKAHAVNRVVDRASAYRMKGVRVDGNDPVAAYDAFQQAISEARSGHGPTLVEATTYRLKGHYLPDPMEYIPADELAAAIAADPLPRYRSWLLEQSIASEEVLAAIDKRAVDANNDALEFALASPPPEPEELTTDVFGVAV